MSLKPLNNMYFLHQQYHGPILKYDNRNPAGEAFAANFGVAEDGAVRPLDYEADSGVLASHFGNKPQGGMQLGTVAVAGILGGPGDIFHEGCRIDLHGREHRIEHSCHHAVGTLLAEESHAVAQRIHVQVTPVFQGIASEQVDPIVRASAVAGDAQLGKFRMASTVRNSLEFPLI